jgi:phospholipase C
MDGLRSNQVYSALTLSPAWPRTLFVINYDEWGGFFDHVPPPTAPIPPADQIAGNEDGRLGFRAPCLVVSPFARRETVAHTQLDHTSVLRTIEWRWSLEPLTVRDATASNLAEVLTFARPDYAAKQLDVPEGPFGTPCLPATPAAAAAPVSAPREEWRELRQVALDFGWPL